MTLSMPFIAETLHGFSKSLDRGKCNPEISPIEDGYSIKLETISDIFCPFYMAITKDMFDISVADTFAIGDVSHDIFDFNDIMLSIASARVSIKYHKSYNLLIKPIMKILITDKESFYITGSVKLFSSRKAREFSGYLLKDN